MTREEMRDRWNHEDYCPGCPRCAAHERRMTSYKCEQCGNIQETRNAIGAGDESWDICEQCESVESLQAF